MPKWPSEVRHLTASCLPQALASSDLVFVHVWASWNCYDGEFANQLELLQQELGKRIEIYAMDADEESNNALVGEWGILNVPAVVLFQQGRRLGALWKHSESVPDFRQRVRIALMRILGQA